MWNARIKTYQACDQIGFPLQLHALRLILPTRCSLDEDRDGCRHAFRPLVTPLLGNATTTGEAALQINKLLWSTWGIKFKPNQTPEIMSPTQVTYHPAWALKAGQQLCTSAHATLFQQVAKTGFASCTGVSIFLVCALRSVGIPARVTGSY